MNLFEEAMARFKKEYANAVKTEMKDPSVMTLATASAQGQPTARTALLENVDKAGFQFSAAQKRRKFKHIDTNPHAALCFYWPPLRKQIHIEGTVEQLNESLFVLHPNRFEFWQSKAYRLHKRTIYTQQGHRWSRAYLYP